MFSTAMFLDVMEVLQKRAHDMSKSKGFWTGEANCNIPSKLCLIHSEVSEWLESHRKGNPPCEKDIQIVENANTRRITSEEEEAADIFIRLLDLCAFRNIDLARVTLAKMEYNANRPHMHGGKVC